MNYDNIPQLIKDTEQFCTWKYEQRKDHMTKVPYNPVTEFRSHGQNYYMMHTPCHKNRWKQVPFCQQHQPFGRKRCIHFVFFQVE